MKFEDEVRRTQIELQINLISPMAPKYTFKHFFSGSHQIMLFF